MAAIVNAYQLPFPLFFKIEGFEGRSDVKEITENGQGHVLIVSAAQLCVKEAKAGEVAQAVEHSPSLCGAPSSSPCTP